MRSLKPRLFLASLALLLVVQHGQCTADKRSMDVKIDGVFRSSRIAFQQDLLQLNLKNHPFSNSLASSQPLDSSPSADIKSSFPTSLIPQELLEQISLAQYCAQVSQGSRLQLGECSPIFITCELGIVHFSVCPTGQVFVNNECRPASTQPACFDISANQLNHATEKLVQATSFCRIHSAPGFIHLTATVNTCSRQALICTTHNQPLTLACPQNFVLDSSKLQCQRAVDQCQFAEKALVQPVKTALERLYCMQHSENDNNLLVMTPLTSPFRAEGLSLANSEARCNDWFVTCPSPDEEFVFCGQDSLFDKEQGACRPTRPSDNCPAIFNCRNFEWQVIPFGKCRAEFIYCQGLIPIQFQCRPDYVLRDGVCVLLDTVREQCEAENQNDQGLSECEKEKERKPDNTNCTRFFECESDENGVFRWQLYFCPNSHGFDPHQHKCSESYQCGAQCHKGQSFLVTCYEYFQCQDHRFQAGICPSKSKYSVEEQRCVFDETCRHADDQEAAESQSKECPEDGFIPSRDCISYGVCKNSILHWKPCQLLNGKYHEQCSKCAIQQSQPSEDLQEMSPAKSSLDVSSNFSPTECTDTAVVLSKNDCRRFMRCYAGQWLMVECPNGKFFSLKTQTCTAETCEATGIYLPLTKMPERLPDYKLLSDKPWCNETLCCTADSPRLAIQTDCQRYKECDTTIGRYTERQCPYNEHFDAKDQKCKGGRDCEAYENDDNNNESGESCSHGLIKPLRKCGHIRICLNEKWIVARCKNGMKFLESRCSKTEFCEESDDSSREKADDQDKQENYGEVCIDNHSKRHPYSCNKYLTCDHGVFIERVCSYGALFNPKTQRCDLNYECDYKNEPKCYEGQLKGQKHNCHAYLRCLEGRYVEETCPEAKVFDDELKACVQGDCHDKDDRDKSDEVPNSAENKDPKKRMYRNRPSKGCKYEWSEDDKDGEGEFEPTPCKESPGVDGYRRDGQKCDRFYQCSNGNWVSKTCPSGTVFNTHISVCDWPRNVPGCEG